MLMVLDQLDVIAIVIIAFAWFGVLLFALIMDEGRGDMIEDV